jgi:hypothetical protein
MKRRAVNPTRSLAAEYGADVDTASVPQLVAAHGLTFSAGPPHD